VRYPDVQLLVAEGSSSVMHEQVLTSRLDTAVVPEAEPPGQLRSQPLLREQLWLVAPRDAGLDPAAAIQLAAQLDRPLILTGRPNALRMIIERALGQAGRQADPVVEANSARLLCELAAHDQGSTVLPFSAFWQALRAGRVSVAPVQGLSVTWTLITSRERGLSLAGRKLREMVGELTTRQMQAGAWQGVEVLD
jgi:LysR family nitrogen assimilation transcriptional regulator